MKFVATQTLLVKRHALVRYPNYLKVVLSNIVDIVEMKIRQQSSNKISSGHQINVNGATIFFVV